MEEIKPLDERDAPQTQTRFFRKMAESSEYILEKHDVSEFRGVYIFYSELGKQ